MLILPFSLLIAYVVFQRLVLEKFGSHTEKSLLATPWLVAVIVVSIGLAFFIIESRTSVAVVARPAPAAPVEQLERRVAELTAAVSTMREAHDRDFGELRKQLSAKESVAYGASSWDTAPRRPTALGVIDPEPGSDLASNRLVDFILKAANPIVGLVYVLLVLFLIERAASIFQWLRGIFAPPPRKDAP